MLIGLHHHTLDEKKRFTIPGKFRPEVGKKVVITRGLDKCLFVHPIQIWEQIAEKLGELPVGQPETRQFLRVLLAGATEVEVDEQGRILIPDHLKDSAGLDRNIEIIGMYKRLEVWDKKEWEQYRAKAEEQQDQIAAKLGEIGVY